MLSFALIGCGRIGRMHAKILSELDGTKLAGVCDIDSASAREVAERHGAKVFASIDDALAAAEVEAVLVASATETHADYIEKAVTAGKPVLCEKPVDLKLDRVLACQKFLRGKDVPVQIGFNRRFDPGHAAARQALRAGDIGELLHVVITSRDPEMPPRAYYEAAGGLFRDMTIHDFDLARFFLGEEPTEVFAVGGRLIDPKLMDELDDHDSGMIILRTASGKLCHINNTRCAVYGYDQRIELHGSLGMLLSDNRRSHELKRYGAAATGAQQPLEYFFIDRYYRSYQAEIEDFVAAVARGAPVPVGFADGLKALQLAEAAYESLATGKLVPVALDQPA